MGQSAVRCRSRCGPVVELLARPGESRPETLLILGLKRDCRAGSLKLYSGTGMEWSLCHHKLVQHAATLDQAALIVASGSRRHKLVLRRQPGQPAPTRILLTHLENRLKLSAATSGSWCRGFRKHPTVDVHP